MRSQKFGKNGTEICELLPHIGSVIDDICLVRSMTTDAINHDPAHMFMNTGSQIAGRPSMGAWVTYGLGQRSRRFAGLRRADLARQRRAEPTDRRAAVEQRISAEPVSRRATARARAIRFCISQSAPASRASSRDDVRRSSGELNQHRRRLVDDPEIATRIAQYEMAFQMQASVPELMDIRRRAANDARALRLPARRRFLRRQLPARPPTGGARRALHPALPQGLGSSLRREGRIVAQGPRNRPRVHGA